MARTRCLRQARSTSATLTPSSSSPTVTILAPQARKAATAYRQTLADVDALAKSGRDLAAVVDTIEDEGGLVNKFEGDAALAVFGAPVNLANPAASALAAARDLADRLTEGLDIGWGIGVSYGEAFAGNIGAERRYEYTVIGDAVNGAARLTDMAKETPGLVLTNAATLRTANEVEQQRWTLMKSVELRGRGKMTQLARPVRSTLADRS